MQESRRIREDLLFIGNTGLAKRYFGWDWKEHTKHVNIKNQVETALPKVMKISKRSSSFCASRQCSVFFG